MVSGAKDEKRQKYTLGKTRKNGEKQPTKKYSENHWLKKYNNNHWLKKYNDYISSACLFPQKQAGETIYGLKLWEQEVARDNGDKIHFFEFFRKNRPNPLSDGRSVGLVG